MSTVDNTKVSVDDTDPRIQWNGPWFTTENFVYDIGNGSPFLNTLHGISSNGSMSFSFYGRSISLWGSLALRNTTLGPDPNWRCLLDGNEIKHPWPLPDSPYSNYWYCAASGPEGNHTLQFNAIIQSETLYIDQVQYRVAPGADVGNAWTEVAHGDGRFNYSPGWIMGEEGYWKWTYTSGAWLTYDFNGTDIIWGGFTPRNARVGPGIGQNNQAYFNVTGLKPGPHRLTVTNAGNESTAALGITYLYTKNGADTTPRGRSGKVIGAAVGGSIGAVLLAVLTILAVIWYRRRKQQRGQDASLLGGTNPGEGMSITSGSTEIREQYTPGSSTQGPWGQPVGFPSHQLSTTPPDGAYFSTTLVAASGSHQPTTFPSDPNPLTSLAGPPRPVMSITPLHPRLQRGLSASSGMPSPTSFAAASNGSQSPASYTAAAPGSSPPSPSFINPNGFTAAGTQQNVRPTQVPIQHIQDGKHQGPYQ